MLRKLRRTIRWIKLFLIGDCSVWGHPWWFGLSNSHWDESVRRHGWNGIYTHWYAETHSPYPGSWRPFCVKCRTPYFPEEPYS